MPTLEHQFICLTHMESTPKDEILFTLMYTGQGANPACFPSECSPNLLQSPQRAQGWWGWDPLTPPRWLQGRCEEGSRCPRCWAPNTGGQRSASCR